MHLRSLFALILTANVLLIAKQTPSQNPVPAGKLKRVSAALAPERVVYEVFAAEVAFRERQVKALSSPSERERLPRERLRTAAGLSEADYAVWAEISQQLMDALAENAKQSDAILNRGQLTAVERSEAIRTLQQKRDDAIDDAIDRWKAHIGIRFRFVDEKIRAYAAPGIRISDMPPAGAAEPGRSHP